jgi:hypothetical protein
MTEVASKKKRSPFLKKMIFAILVLLVIAFIMNKLGISLGTISDETEIIDPYKGN